MGKEADQATIENLISPVYHKSWSFVNISFVGNLEFLSMRAFASSQDVSEFTLRVDSLSSKIDDSRAGSADPAHLAPGETLR